MTISIQLATIQDHEKIRAFYRSCGYARVVGSLDAVLVAKEGANIVGAVRLLEERGVLVLRGMYIARDKQRRGIGGRLLDEFRKLIRGRECYCIPYGHLEGFYGKIGFVRIDESRAPAHLKDRAEEYRALEKDVIIMRREAGLDVF